MKPLEIILLILAFLASVVLLLQGLLKTELLPITFIALALGFDPYSPANFFIIPFLFFAFKFLIMFVKPFYLMFTKGRNFRMARRTSQMASDMSAYGKGTLFGIIQFDIEKNVLIDLGVNFFGLLFDFFVWVLSFWLALMIMFVLISVNYVENGGPDFFFVLLNFVIGFFILFSVLKMLGFARFVKLIRVPTQ